MLYFMVHIHHPFWFLNLHPILFEHLVFFLFCVCKRIICLGKVFVLVMLLIPMGDWIIGRRAGLLWLNGKRFARLFHFLINIYLFLQWLHLLAAFDVNLLMLRTVLAKEMVLWTIDLYADFKVNEKKPQPNKHRFLFRVGIKLRNIVCCKFKNCSTYFCIRCSPCAKVYWFDFR